MDEELGYSKYDYRNKETDNSRNVIITVRRSRQSGVARATCPD